MASSADSLSERDDSRSSQESDEGEEEAVDFDEEELASLVAWFQSMTWGLHESCHFPGTMIIDRSTTHYRFNGAMRNVQERNEYATLHRELTTLRSRIQKVSAVADLLVSPVLPIDTWVTTELVVLYGTRDVLYRKISERLPSSSIRRNMKKPLDYLRHCISVASEEKLADCDVWLEQNLAVTSPSKKHTLHRPEPREKKQKKH